MKRERIKQNLEDFLGDPFGVRLTEELAHAKYPQPVKTDEDAGKAWLALKREMIISRLKRNEVAIVGNDRTGKHYVQWKEVAKFVPCKEAGIDPLRVTWKISNEQLLKILKRRVHKLQSKLNRRNRSIYHKYSLHRVQLSKEDARKLRELPPFSGSTRFRSCS